MKVVDILLWMGVIWVWAVVLVLGIFVTMMLVALVVDFIKYGGPWL